MALSGRIKASIQATLTGSPDVGAAKHAINQVFTQEFTDGGGADQATKMWTDTRTLSASGTENLDFAAGVTDALGNVLTFASIKAIFITAAAGNTNDVQVTRPSINGLIGPFIATGDGLALSPGGCFLVTDFGATGWAVTADTGDLLTVTNSGSGTGVTYTIVVIGD